MKKSLNIVLICVCVGVLCFSGYQLVSYFAEYTSAEQAYEEIRAPELADSTSISNSTYEDLLPYYKKLHEQNDHFVGWLTLPGTNVNYPVMQTPQEPNYYLYRDFHQKDTPSGSLFASEHSSVTKPSDVVIINGHRMKTGAMFGNFGRLLDRDYLTDHSNVVFDNLIGRNEYKIWCVFTESVDTGNPGEFQYFNYSDFGSEAEFNSFVSQAKALSNIDNPDVTPKYGDRFLLLSTCEYTHDNGRLVVVCILTTE